MFHPALCRSLLSLTYFSLVAPELTGEGLYCGDTDIITHREETINMIKDILQKNHFVHIKAPPFSGKTSLAQLLAKY